MDFYSFAYESDVIFYCKYCLKIKFHQVNNFMELLRKILGLSDYDKNNFESKLKGIILT